MISLVDWKIAIASELRLGTRSRTRSKDAQVAQTYATRIFLSRHLGIHHHHRCAMSQCRGVSRIPCVSIAYYASTNSFPSPHLTSILGAAHLSRRGEQWAPLRGCVLSVRQVTWLVIFSKSRIYNAPVFPVRLLVVAHHSRCARCQLIEQEQCKQSSKYLFDKERHRSFIRNGKCSEYQILKN